MKTNAPKLYPVWRKESKLGYQYLIGLSTSKGAIVPRNISVYAQFVYYISAFTRQQAIDTLKQNLRNAEPKPMYKGHAISELESIQEGI